MKSHCPCCPKSSTSKSYQLSNIISSATLDFSSLLKYTLESSSFSVNTALTTNIVPCTSGLCHDFPIHHLARISACLADPLPGHAVHFASDSFPSVCENLRVGNCHFLNLPLSPSTVSSFSSSPRCFLSINPLSSSTCPTVYLSIVIPLVKPSSSFPRISFNLVVRVEITNFLVRLVTDHIHNISALGLSPRRLKSLIGCEYSFSRNRAFWSSFDYTSSSDSLNFHAHSHSHTYAGSDSDDSGVALPRCCRTSSKYLSRRTRFWRTPLNTMLIYSRKIASQLSHCFVLSPLSSHPVYRGKTYLPFRFAYVSRKIVQNVRTRSPRSSTAPVLSHCDLHCNVSKSSPAQLQTLNRYLMLKSPSKPFTCSLRWGCRAQPCKIIGIPLANGQLKPPTWACIVLR